MGLGWWMAAALAMAPSEAVKAETAHEVAIGAGVTAGVGVGVGFAVAARTMWAERCEADRARERAGTDDDDSSGAGLDLECWGAQGLIFTVPVVALSVSTVVLSAVAGDRFGVADRLAARRLPRRAALGYTLGGIGVRVAGAALIAGGAALSGLRGCPDRASGDLGCARARTYGAAAVIGAGALARWTGTGMLAFGARHLRDERRRPALTLEPSLLGVSGRF
ncbi:MAG: hypothetical protein AAF721_13330 [Myxococcota bacterium]